MKEDTIADIERAIENVRLFNEQQKKPSQASADSLQKSIDLLKVYTSAAPKLQQGTEKEQQLAKQVVDAAKKYNDIVRKKKLPPSTIGSILKQFFLRMSGKANNPDLIHHEIHIPYLVTTQEAISPYKITINEHAQDKIRSVLQSVQRNTTANYDVPKQAELDLFRTKTLSLLLEQNVFPIALEEALTLIKKSPISHIIEEGTYLLHNSILHLHQKICPFPGIETETTGAFERDPFHPEVVAPVKGSFHNKTHISQTGLSYPVQHIGIGLHEKLIPNCLLRPQMCPKFKKFIREKELLSQKLLPSGSLYQKAKALLQKKIALYNTSQELFLSTKSLLKAHHNAAAAPFQEIAYSPNWYEELSYNCTQFLDKIFGAPINSLQEEWLLKQNKNILTSPYEQGFVIMNQTLQDALKEELLPYSKEATYSFGRAGISLHLMQLSEHLNFEPHDLTNFEKTLLTSLFRQQLIFSYELQELDEKQLQKHLIKVINDEINLFNNTPSNDTHTLQAQELAEELFQYYSVRFETQ